MCLFVRVCGGMGVTPQVGCVFLSFNQFIIERVLQDNLIERVLQDNSVIFYMFCLSLRLRLWETERVSERVDPWRGVRSWQQFAVGQRRVFVCLPMRENERRVVFSFISL